MNAMRISQLAERTGVPATTLRFYETAGLLSAERTPAGYRLYGQEAVERLAFIKEAKHLGLPLEDIAELLRVWESGSCAEVRADLRPRIAARITEAEQRAVELSAFITVLRQALGHLDSLPDSSSRCGPRCAFLSPETERWRTAPIACSLTGKRIAERAQQWRRLLSGATGETIIDGVRLVLPADRTSEVAALAVAEQGCCPFFDFRLHLDGPELRLEVRAPAEGADLLAELFTPAS